MFTPDESLEQVRSAGRAATSARANAELLTSPNVAMISVSAYQGMIDILRRSRQMAVQEKLRAEGFRRVLLPHLEAGSISQGDAVAALQGQIDGVEYTKSLFADVIANLQRARSSLVARTDIIDMARPNFERLVQDLGHLAQVCEIIRAHCQAISTNMQAARLAPSMQALTNRGALIGNLCRWLEDALSVYAAQLASV